MALLTDTQMDSGYACKTFISAVVPTVTKVIITDTFEQSFYKKRWLAVYVVDCLSAVVPTHDSIFGPNVGRAKPVLFTHV